MTVKIAALILALCRLDSGAYRSGSCRRVGPQTRKVLALRNAMRRVTVNDPMPLALRVAVSL